MNLVMLIRGRMTRTTPELAPPLSKLRTTPTGGRLATTYDLTARIHGGSSVESGFEPGTLRPLSRDFTTRPPRHPSNGRAFNLRWIYRPVQTTIKIFC
ncbi:hypothetical protein AVEN_161647-1 [Araneus ventricosus]|uniref:Uncharacterized protein n=1 Tax=Araneus ventricosus TaxID=182803 RepID=A0A4Y2W0D2_ARAVE|nr:hypothetical protein AVEN_36042-1 [Araneus ventricosus]GBO30011.1 hypothetical protein AVEN_161647-1 [Araneus ventricosus]